jgi:hypothetical protein
MRPSAASLPHADPSVIPDRFLGGTRRPGLNIRNSTVYKLIRSRKVRTFRVGRSPSAARLSLRRDRQPPIRKSTSDEVAIVGLLRALVTEPARLGARPQCCGCRLPRGARPLAAGAAQRHAAARRLHKRRMCATSRHAISSKPKERNASQSSTVTRDAVALSFSAIAHSARSRGPRRRSSRHRLSLIAAISSPSPPSARRNSAWDCVQ